MAEDSEKKPKFILNKQKNDSQTEKSSAATPVERKKVVVDRFFIANVSITTRPWSGHS